jgi:hypothetical protein
MSSYSQSHGGRVAIMRLAVVALLCSAGTLAAAEDQAPKLELFGGYSFLYPGADVHGTLPGGLLPLTSRLESNPRGAGASITYNFNRWLGLTLDGSGNWGSGETTLGKRIDDSGFYNISGGPKVTFRSAHFSPFFEALVGGPSSYARRLPRYRQAGVHGGRWSRREPGQAFCFATDQGRLCNL